MMVLSLTLWKDADSDIPHPEASQRRVRGAEVIADIRYRCAVSHIRCDGIAPLDLFSSLCRSFSMFTRETFLMPRSIPLSWWRMLPILAIAVAIVSYYDTKLQKAERRGEGRIHDTG